VEEQKGTMENEEKEEAKLDGQVSKEDREANLQMMERENAILKENLELKQREFELNKVSGQSEAGKPSEPTEEEKEKEAARNLLKGTGFEDVVQ